MKRDREGNGMGRRWVRSMGLAALIALGSPLLRAQTPVEARLAALEGRIQQLERELAVARGSASSAIPMQQTSGVAIQPAVLLTSSGRPVLVPTEVAEPAVAMAPRQQDTLGGELEGLNFFKGVKFGGFLDAYYGFNFDEPGDRKVPYRNFDFNHNSLTLSQVSFDMSKPVSETSPLGYMLQMGFGPTADWVNSGDPLIGNFTAAHFFQYYLSGRVPVGNGLILDVGKFVTQHGAEVIDTRADWNYSRGLLFAWAIPYYHFGVRATYPASDKLTLAAFLVNGWNNVIDNNGGKTGGLQLIWNPTSRLSFIQNYMFGPEQTDVSDSDNYRHLWDTLLTIKLHEKVTFMTNFDYGMDRIVGGEHVHWIGTANYLRFQLTDSFALIPRFEFYSDPMGFTTGARQQLKEFTITPEFIINENLVTRFEYRRDWTNAGVFGGDTQEDARSQDTAAVGLILKF
ncbi:MAG: outer membrane beta-barrel protein [Acidobacteria bacterium]|nr:outer membrane beta-barrel protein [Acidobacteriota bacterium]